MRQLRRNAASWSRTSSRDVVRCVNSYVAGKRKPSIERLAQSLRKLRGRRRAPPTAQQVAGPRQPRRDAALLDRDLAHGCNPICHVSAREPSGKMIRSARERWRRRRRRRGVSLVAHAARCCERAPPRDQQKRSDSASHSCPASREIALEEMRCGASVLVGAARLRCAASAVVKRSSYGPDGHRRRRRGAPSTNASVSSACAPRSPRKRQRQPDDDALGLVLTHERRDASRARASLAARATTPSGRAIVPVASETATPVRAAP